MVIVVACFWETQKTSVFPISLVKGSLSAFWIKALQKDMFVWSDLNFFSVFIIDFSNEMPFFYGLFTIMFAVILGVGAAFIRRFISNFRKKLAVKS